MRLRRYAFLCSLAAAAICFALGGRLAAATFYDSQTTTPIRHVIVIFDENNSFDHYFGTYPRALNPEGEPPFTALPNTPAVNGLTPALMTNNPNSAQPFRLDRSLQLICDNDNHYADEQKAYDAGLMDKFVQNTDASGAGCTPDLNMGYYDGNTVTALWNYAQLFSMSDNFFATEFGTTVMGQLNLISGQTHQNNVASISGKVVNGSVIANIDPVMDDCSTGSTVAMTSTNIGDVMNLKGVSWGWFYGDWSPTNPGATPAQCSANYDPHYAPFQYYATTANPHHLPPTAVSKIGLSDQANHQYALTDFWAAAKGGYLPAVSFIKPPAVDTGHPNTSTALMEQDFLVTTINQLMQLPEWKTMAILITYDDSDGWYDHVMPPIVNQSSDPANDTLLGSGMCGTAAPGAFLDRCGYGPRLPFLVISPFARQNFVDHSLADQTSIIRFIEDNWSLGRLGGQSFDALAGPILNNFDFSSPHYGALTLDPTSGEVVRGARGQ